VAKVVIGVDPHKRLNAVVVINIKGKVLARRQFPSSVEGFRELRSFGRQWRPRTWAVEGCNGVGKYLAQRLVAAGERVVDVSTRRAALVRVFAGGNGRKNDDVDAHSVALVGLHTRDLPEVQGRPQRIPAAASEPPQGAGRSPHTMREPPAPRPGWSDLGWRPPGADRGEGQGVARQYPPPRRDGPASPPSRR
jgi:hypothetical protein